MDRYGTSCVENVRLQMLQITEKVNAIQISYLYNYEYNIRNYNETKPPMPRRKRNVLQYFNKVCLPFLHLSMNNNYSNRL